MRKKLEYSIGYDKRVLREKEKKGGGREEEGGRVRLHVFIIVEHLKLVSLRLFLQFVEGSLWILRE